MVLGEEQEKPEVARDIGGAWRPRWNTVECHMLPVMEADERGRLMAERQQERIMRCDRRCRASKRSSEGERKRAAAAEGSW
jgi:hypothetical protein